MQDSWEKTEIIYISWNCEKLPFKHYDYDDSLASNRETNLTVLKIVDFPEKNLKSKGVLSQDVVQSRVWLLFT